MAEKTDKKGKPELHAELLKAREAKVNGDHRRAREFAQDVLADAAATEEAKAEATALVQATTVDRTPIIVGLVIAVVLAGLFTFVANQPHVH